MARSENPVTVRRRIITLLDKIERDVLLMDCPELDTAARRLKALRTELEAFL